MTDRSDAVAVEDAALATMDDERPADPALLRWAAALTKDEDEAAGLVARTLRLNAEAAPSVETDHETRVALYRAMRQSYHSIERGKPVARRRGPALTPPGAPAAAEDDSED